MAIANADGSIILSTKVDTSGLNKGMSQMEGKATGLTKAFSKLGATIVAAFAVQKMVQFGREAINLASDLQEVQNVVDVAFGEMSYKIEQFSKTAIENFGISELTAKRTASTYMAMAKGMGIVDDVASDMAITMTGLTADLASFYNISQERADVILKSVYTGETETLKQLGIVMTEVNLQNFAMSQGITKNISKMTQQEKTMLRYQYVLKQTALAQGDFVRTQDSWANQTRVLQERWKEMQATFGEVFVSIGVLVLPVIEDIIKGLNQIAIMVKAVASSFGLFKEETETTNNTAEVLTEESEKTAKNIEEQADAQKDLNKEMKKTLAGFDDIQILTGNVAESARIDEIFSPSAILGNASLGGQETSSSFDPMNYAQKIKDALEYLLPIIELSLVAIGLLIISTGNIPLGIGFIAAGAYLYSVSERSSGTFDFGVIRSDLQFLSEYIEEALVAIGIILIFLGNLPMGIGFIIAGAAIYGAKEVSAQEYSGLDIQTKLAVIMEYVSAGLVAIGVILIMFGHIPLGIGFLFVGYKMLDITEKQLNEGGVTTKIQRFFEENQKLFVGVGLALVVLGLILLFTPLSFGLAFALIATGATALVTQSEINGTKITEDIRNFISNNAELIKRISGGLLVLGIILCFVPGALPLAIALIAVGAVGLVTETAVNEGVTVGTIKRFINSLVQWIKSYGLLVLGILLCLTGVGLPIGIALIMKWVKKDGENGYPLTKAAVEAVKNLWKEVKDFWNQHIAEVFTWEWWYDLAKSSFQGLIDAAQWAIQEVGSTLGGLFGAGALFGSYDLIVESTTGKSTDDATEKAIKEAMKKMRLFGIPGFAQGTVVPPNKEFLAVLGDNTKEHEIVSPLSTMKQAFTEALVEMGGNFGSGNIEVVLEIDGREFGRAVVEQGNKENRRIGTRLVIV